MAWRPLNASELAVGCLGGCLVWTVDPTSVATRPSASCVAVLPAPKGHAPVTGVEWDPRVSSYGFSDCSLEIITKLNVMWLE